MRLSLTPSQYIAADPILPPVFPICSPYAGVLDLVKAMMWRHYGKRDRDGR